MSASPKTRTNLCPFLDYRERTKKVYTMYSRKPEREVWQNLRELRVNFAVLEESWCTRRSR